MIAKIFRPLMEITMDGYINDMVVITTKEWEHLKDLAEVFKILKEHNMRLNAANCTFKVSSGKFFGHLVIK